ncbi:hypothetical protein [Moritella sp. Urea-trap-13]|uniref:AAA family ATPase n=1 Tax=Moritella sp. Urea-trap-13 TaxID=2058327 RepID=UPI000C34C16D|nr:hypothetical protein [Moritella sp. Urea-trap-13]PKH06281.1 hypothetical protein CXF93_10175 [Moritella sp. Urea-trap-13]
MNNQNSNNIIGFSESNSAPIDRDKLALPFPLNCLVICQNPTMRQHLSTYLATVTNLKVDYCTVLDSNVNNHNLVIFVLDSNDLKAKDNIKEIAKHDINFILVADNISNDVIRTAVHFKVKDIISQQDVEQELFNSLLNSANELIQTSKIAPLYTVINGKPGSGASFITSCLGEISANISNEEIAIIDADLNYGSLADTFNFDANYYLTDALNELDKLDNTAIKSMMQKRDNLSLLASKPYTQLNTNSQTLGYLDQLVWKVKLNHDLVLVDLSRGIERFTIPLLNLSSKVLIVVQQNILNLREAKVLIQQLTQHLGIDTDKLHIIVNRYSTKNSNISLDDIKKVLNIDKLYVVSNNYQLANAGIDSGSPLLKVADHKVIQEEVSHIIGELFPIEVPVKTTLLSKIFRRL